MLLLCLSPFSRKLSSDLCFSLILARVCCGLTKTVTETSARCGEEAQVEMVNKITGGPCAD